MKFRFNKSKPFKIKIVVVIDWVGNDVDTNEVVEMFSKETCWFEKFGPRRNFSFCTSFIILMSYWVADEWFVCIVGRSLLLITFLWIWNKLCHNLFSTFDFSCNYIKGCFLNSLSCVSQFVIWRQNSHAVTFNVV